MADQNNEIQNLHIRMQILTILDECKGFPLRESALHVQLGIMIDGITVTTDELGIYLEYLRAHGMIDFDMPQVGGPRRWQITEDGKQAFREYNHN